MSTVAAFKQTMTKAKKIALIPIPGVGENETLRGLEPERVDVGDEDQEAGELLAALHDAELRGLLDGVDGVAAGVREPDDLGSDAFAWSRNEEKSVPGNG